MPSYVLAGSIERAALVPAAPPWFTADRITTAEWSSIRTTVAELLSGAAIGEILTAGIPGFDSVELSMEGIALINRRSVTIFGMLFLAAAPAMAQQRPKGPPSASVTIQQVQVAFIGSGAIGGGTLKYGGKTYPITVGGLGIGGIGASRLTATGSVYGLKRREDFAGTYVQIRAGWALGDQGRGTLWLQNTNGVSMKLNTQREGLQLSLGADGVVIAFK
jgi:hypothetical protein